MPKSRNRKRDKKKIHREKVRKIRAIKEAHKKKRDMFRQELLLKHMKKAIENEPANSQNGQSNPE